MGGRSGAARAAAGSTSGDLSDLSTTQTVPRWYFVETQECKLPYYYTWVNRVLRVIGFTALQYLVIRIISATPCHVSRLVLSMITHGYLGGKVEVLYLGDTSEHLGGTKKKGDRNGDTRPSPICLNQSKSIAIGNSKEKHLMSLIHIQDRRRPPLPLPTSTVAYIYTLPASPFSSVHKLVCRTTDIECHHSAARGRYQLGEMNCFLEATMPDMRPPNFVTFAPNDPSIKAIFQLSALVCC